MPETEQNGTAPALPEKFSSVLSAPLPDPATMDSVSRLSRLMLYREMTLAGVKLPPEHIRAAITMITLDRASKAREARATSKEAKAASSPAKIPDINDL